MKIPGFYCAIALSCFILFSVEALADMRWDEKTETVLSAGDSVLSTVSASKKVGLKRGGVRIEDSDTREIRLCNFSNRTCVIISEEGKAVEVLSHAEMKRIYVDEQKKHESSVMARLKNSSADDNQSKAMDQAEYDAISSMRRAKYADAVLFKPAEERRDIDGHPCRRFIGSSGEVTYVEAWVAEDILSEPAFLDYGDFMSEYEPLKYKFFRRLPGFPLKLVLHYGPMTITTNVTNYREDRLPVSEFLLPKGAELSDH